MNRESASAEQGNPSHQPTGTIKASEQIEAFFKCSVTLQTFFEPAMISGCGHFVEGSAASGLDKCPLCRGEEQENDRGIMLVPAPPSFIGLLATTLAADPRLWQDVHLDHDYLARVLSNDELRTPTGERFIQLLENNTVENLNQSFEGIQQGKSVIEILASYYPGRELLRRNAKVQALMAEKTKQRSVEGKTIAEWLMAQEEKPEAMPRSVHSARLFSNNPVSSRQPEDTVWQRVVYANENGVLAMILANPDLVEQRGTAFDYSGREVEGTPYQMTLRTGDDVMKKAIEMLYLTTAPDEETQQRRQESLDTQWRQVFPNGYDAHLREQKQSADQFEREVLNPLVAAFDNASIADLQAALEKRDNGSVLYQQLEVFKTAFRELSHQEKVYNPTHLLKVNEKFKAKFDGWYSKFGGGNWSHLDLFWRQVIGWEERYMSTNWAQSFCTGLYRMGEDGAPLNRTLVLHNYISHCDINFFPLDADAACRLGVDFGIYSGGGGPRGNVAGAERVVRSGVWDFARAPCLQNLCRAKTASLGELRSQNRVLGARPGV